MLFKGGTALRIVFHSPRYSEDLDFTGINITHAEVEDIFMSTLEGVENTGIRVELLEGKPTSGGYIGLAIFYAYGRETRVHIEVSLRPGPALWGITTPIENDYITAYTLVHLPEKKIITGKLQALMDRHKPRDFYDYWFLLSGNHPIVKEKENLTRVLALLKESKLDFRRELREFLPASHLMHLRDFKKTLESKILSFLGDTP